MDGRPQNSFLLRVKWCLKNTAITLHVHINSRSFFASQSSVCICGVSQSWAPVLAVGPHAQIFPCPWNLFILCAVDDDSKPLQFHIEEQYSEILQMQFFTSSHHVVLLLLLSVNHNSCTLLVQLFLLTITLQPLAAPFQLLKYKTEKNGKMSQFELFSMFYDGFMIFANHCLCVYT